MSVFLAALLSLFLLGEDPTSSIVSDASGGKCCEAKCSARCDAAAPANVVQQVQLRVLIADVDCDKLKDFGFQFVTKHNRAATTDWADGSDESDGEQPCPSSTFCRENNFAFGAIKNEAEFRVFLTDLKGRGFAKIQTDTKLGTYSGRPGSFRDGGEFPIPVSDGDGKVTVEFRDYGNRFDCVPHVLANGRIRLEIDPEITEVDHANGVKVAGYSIPAIKTRRLETTVELGQGEAFVVNGLYSVNGSPTGDKGPCVNCLLCNAAAGAPERELVILVSAEAVPPATSAAESKSAVWRAAKHKSCCAATHAVTHAIAEFADADSDQPHPPAAETCRGHVCPYICHDKTGPMVREIEVKVDEQESGRVVLGLGLNSDTRLLGGIVLKEVAKPTPACTEGCCHVAAAEKTCDAACCHHDDACVKPCPAHCEEDDEGECDVLFCPEDIVAAHIHHVQQMIAARIQWESALLQAKSAAETALARQQAKNAEEMLEVRAEHLAELQKQKEAMWESERRATEARHRQALEHEHELAELRVRHLSETYEQQYAAMKNEIWTLRERLGVSEPDRAARPRAHPTVAAPRTSKTEQPVVLEDRLEQVEYSTPSAHASRAHPSEVDRLRREVARLRALVEDLLCIAPDAPPAPVPQKPYDEPSE